MLRIWLVALIMAGATRSYADEPVYAKTRPYIYLGAHKARLQKALGGKSPAAFRFKGRVAAWLKGEDIWGFPAWNAALLGALTGDAAPCTKAITVVDAQVTTARSRPGT